MWPTSVRQLIDYSNERYQNECGKTVLNSLQASLAVLEQVGKVAEPDRLSNDVTWQAHLKSLTALNHSLVRPVQQAPMLTVAMVVSLELHVGRDDEPEYCRAIAFVALIAVYGSMRMDDLQGFDWLGVGYAIWKKYDQPRDFLVLTARDDWKGPTRHFAKSEVVAGYVREVFKRLATPKFEDGAYRLNVQ
eukprot:s11949_g1.t1